MLRSFGWHAIRPARAVKNSHLSVFCIEAAGKVRGTLRENAMTVRWFFVSSTIALALLTGAATAVSACGLPPDIGIAGPPVDVNPAPTDIVTSQQPNPADPISSSKESRDRAVAPALPVSPPVSGAVPVS